VRKSLPGIRGHARTGAAKRRGKGCREERGPLALRADRLGAKGLVSYPPEDYDVNKEKTS